MKRVTYEVIKPLEMVVPMGTALKCREISIIKLRSMYPAAKRLKTPGK